ncbi:MAG: ATP-binding protein [Betaproteobacteria bacterium]
METLGAFRAFIERACRAAGIAETTIDDLKLAIDEAAMNVIMHGYAGMDPGSLMLELDIGADKVDVALTDFGHPFEPYDPGVPDADSLLGDHAPGGFGLHIIYRTMDDVAYHTDEEGNHLSLVKKLAAG